MIGRPDTDFFPAELCFGNPGKGIRGFHADDDDVLKGRNIHNPYNPGTLKDGSVRVFDTYKLPLRDIEGNVYGVMVYSVILPNTRQMEEQYRHAQRMEAVGLLAGGVAHDFNNIINAMQGFCSLVQMKMKSDDPSAHYLNQILALTERAGSLTKSLLAFSRKQEIAVQPINLNETVSAVGKLLLKVLGEDISLNLKFSQKEIVVLADSGQIDQVIMNLATNARDAMPDGGTLTISTELVTIDEAFQKTHGSGERAAMHCSPLRTPDMAWMKQREKESLSHFLRQKRSTRAPDLACNRLRALSISIMVCDGPERGRQGKLFPIVFAGSGYAEYRPSGYAIDSLDRRFRDDTAGRG